MQKNDKICKKKALIKKKKFQIKVILCEIVI